MIKTLRDFDRWLEQHPEVKFSIRQEKDFLSEEFEATLKFRVNLHSETKGCVSSMSNDLTSAINTAIERFVE